MTIDLTAAKVFQNVALSLDIPPGTALPEHVESYMVDIGSSQHSGPYVKVYLCDAAAEADEGIILGFSDRAGFREAYRLARQMRPGGRLNGGRHAQ